MNPQKSETKKTNIPQQKRPAQHKDTPSDSAPNPDSHVKPSEPTDIKKRASPSPEIEISGPPHKPDIANDLTNDDWKDNPGHQVEREMPNELYNETLPPDYRVVN
jgi:hypothetical protein